MPVDKARPKIFLGVPCYGDVAPDVLEDFMRFAFHLGRRMPQYDFALGIRTKAEQFRARNQIVEGAQAEGCDWVLMLDDDMIINEFVTLGPSDSYGFLEKLIAHDKDICGALYYQKGGGCVPVLMKAVDSRGYRFLRDDEVTHDLQRVDVAGGGCLLIKTKVFDHLPYPYFGPEFEYGTDVQLCRAALLKGYEVWADTSIELGHLKPERTIITSRNRHQYQLENSTPGEVKQQFVSTGVYDDLLRDAVEWTGYKDLGEMTQHAQAFFSMHAAYKASGGTDAGWYRQFPKERVARQMWFNTQSSHKRTMTEFILNSVDHRKRQDVLDFGCGIGIPAYTLAQKGHRVTAVDIDGTGTFEFLQWRANKANLPIKFWPSQGGVFRLGLPAAEFDVIVAMDCLEHLPEWREQLRELVSHLRPGGVLFSNNAVLDDITHPEHYPLKPKDFVAECVKLNLMPFNQIAYVNGLVTNPPGDEKVTDLVHA